MNLQNLDAGGFIFRSGLAMVLAYVVEALVHLLYRLHRLVLGVQFLHPRLETRTTIWLSFS